MTVPALRVDFSQGPAILAMTATQGTGTAQVPPAGIFTYTDRASGPILEWKNISAPGGNDVLLLVSDVVSCNGNSQNAVQQMDVEAADVSPAFAIENEATFAQPQQILVPHDSSITAITCRMNVKPLHATYSQRRLQLVSDVIMGQGDAQWHPVTTTIYTINPRDAQDLRVTHADVYSGSMHYDNTWIRSGSSDGNPVAVQWEDEGSTRIHEFVYFIAAAIIGLSVSCMLEAARPWIAGRGGV